MSTTKSDAPLEYCDACLAGGIIPGEPQGTESELGGLKYYIAKGTGESTKVVVIAADIFGLGEYPPVDKLITQTMQHPMNSLSLLTRLWTAVGLVVPLLRFVGPLFFWRHRMGVLVPLFEKFVGDLETEKGVKDVAVVGYCLGGQLATLVASSPTLPLKAVIVAHPGPLSASNFASVKAPFALICAEEDLFFDRIKEAAVVALKETAGKEVAVAVYEHPGTVHGFACRPDVAAPVSELAYQAALTQTVEWIKSHF
ncbi:hypothetical protein RQP46_009885 [Phenoliferia psychrophenolica]